MAAAAPRVRFETSMGPFVLELDEAKAPVTVQNFLSYVDSGHYDGTIFHRVISNFMIQGGGFTPDMKQKPTKPAIKNESANGLKNDKYTVAMARTSEPHSATCQFFINVTDSNGFLNRDQAQDGVGYCVFGKVVEGTEIVDQIKGVKTGTTAGHQNVPATPVVIHSAKRA